MIKKKKDIKEIQKRDGSMVPFDGKRIMVAVYKAMQATGEGSESSAQDIANKVVESLKDLNDKDFRPNVELIQDFVENELIKTGFTKTVKAYMMYRSDRHDLRQKRGFVPEKVKELVDKSKKYFRNPLAELVYYRTYSKWIPEEGRRETWIETVDRYMEFMKENIGSKISEVDYKDVRESILNQRSMPSMRLLQFAGKAARKTNICAYNCLTGDTMVLTREMGLISIGEAYKYGELSVLSHDKKWRLSPVNYFGEQDVVDVTITKGKRKKIISATLDHKWYIDGKFKTTKELIGASKKIKSDKISPIISEKPDDNNNDYKKGVIHGIVYGDGTTTKRKGKKTGHMIRLCSDSKELLKFFSGYKFSYPKSYNGDPVVYLYDKFAKNTNLKDLPVDCSDSYMLGFIRGWLAADGSISKQGQTILATNEKGKEWLMRYSGIVGLPTGHYNEFPIITNYGVRKESLFRVYFFDSVISENDLLKENHKKNIKIKNIDKRYSEWSIQSVSKKTRKENVYCFTVDDTATFTLEEGIITGNCSFISPKSFQDFAEIMYVSMCGTGVGFSVESEGIQSLPQIKKQTGKKHPTYVIPDSKEGWANALAFGMKTWFDGEDVEFDYSLIRPAGSRLKTMGGKSSGPEPIMSLLNFTRERILRKQGRRLANIDAHDIICKIGECVVSGGVRRSAMISLSDLDDDTLRDAKKGQFYINEAQRMLSNNSAVYNTKPTTEEFLDEWTALVKSGSGERGIFNRGGLVNTLPKRRTDQWKGIEFPRLGTNPCGEIILKSKEFCNLSEIVARAEDTEETLMEKMRTATILGTYQSSLTYFPYLSKEWKKNCDTERLLGVSITGQWDCPVVRNPEVLDRLRLYSIEVNKKYAKKMGIPASTCITAVKPSGTVSQTVDCSSGMHTRHAPYYIRRVRISATDALFKMLKEQGVPYYPEVGQTIENATTYVLEFPVKAPEGAICRDDLTAIDQLEHWKVVKEHYTEHNPSVTISVGEDEWLEVGSWIYKNWEIVGGLSFLPRSNHVYQLAPYETITKEKYEEMVANMGEIDFSQIVTYEKEDETEVKKELACVSGVCEV